MRLALWTVLSVIVLGTITPTLLIISTSISVLNYVGDKLANLLMHIDNNVGYELDQQRLRMISRKYFNQRKKHYDNNNN